MPSSTTALTLELCEWVETGQSRKVALKTTCPTPMFSLVRSDEASPHVTDTGGQDTAVLTRFSFTTTTRIRRSTIHYPKDDPDRFAPSQNYPREIGGAH